MNRRIEPPSGKAPHCVGHLQRRSCLCLHPRSPTHRPLPTHHHHPPPPQLAQSGGQHWWHHADQSCRRQLGQSVHPPLGRLPGCVGMMHPCAHVRLCPHPQWARFWPSDGHTRSL